MKASGGFSLVELLVATVIMGLLITVVLAPLTNLFQNTATSGQRLRVTTQAQELTEYVRGQWQSYPIVMTTDATGSTTDQNLAKRADSRNRYDRTCFAVPDVTNMTQQITVRALDRNASETGTLSHSTCPNPLTAPASPADVPIKRINVTLTAPDGSRSSLTLDIPRP